jgi:hypothetical protein
MGKLRLNGTMKRCAFAFGLFLNIALVSCARSPEPIHNNAPVASSSSDEDSNLPIGMVDATIMFTDCSVRSDMNTKLAQKTMRQLVEACNEVPGGTAQFSATLNPGGRIELSTVDGGLGTVPICVLHHELKHKVVVKKPCTMQVQMTERKTTSVAARDAGLH